MTPAAERYSRMRELFQAVVDLPPAERAAMLESQDDVALREEVGALLKADAQSDEFGEEPAFVLPPDLFAETNEGEDQLAGREFGAYRIIREIGRGGLGAVYLAARADDEYRKEVALKLIRRGLDTADILRRFRTERQILAQLDHPNIARLLDGGTSEDGLPYFVMEYVQGEPISTYCDLHGLKLNERLELFRKVCAAVTYAHQNLVVHRDLKPSNILVTPDCEPKLLDFGIAKLLTAEDELFTQTAPGLRAMTPDYASPEQIKGEKITTASDVYSLGVLLYELLTGQKPYRVKTRTSEEISRAVVEQEPHRPSTTPATDRDSTVGSDSFRRSALDGDLDNVVLMALRKEPERRYSSVAQFSEDIRRHLEGRPVIAHKDTFKYRATKFIRRNTIALAAAALLLLTLLGGIVTTAWQAQRATQQARIADEQARVASAARDRAQREGAKAQSINTFLQNILGLSDPTWVAANARGDAHERTIADAIDEAVRRAETELADQPEVLAAVQFSIGRIYAHRGRVDRSEVLLRSSLDIRRRVLGSEHPETAQSMAALGEQLTAAGKTAESDPLLREAVAFFRRAPDKDVADLKWFAIALNGLGMAQTARGEAAAGEQFLLESLQVSESLSGTDRGLIPVVLNNLSILRGEQGDVAAAIDYLERSLEEYRRAPGDLRYYVATALTNLAFWEVLKADYSKAESLLREAIDLFRATVGEENQRAAITMIHLANTHYLRGDYRQAREAIDRVIGIQHRFLTEGHVDFARSWIVLGNILTRTGDPMAGETYLRKALELRNRAFAQGHWRIAEVQMALGDCLLQQARLTEAEHLLVTSHSALSKKLGPGDPRTLEAQRLLGRCNDSKSAAPP
ncbi:hypothetical protein BH20VER1_BH20VER1_15490 [soil metagenome]